MKNTPYVGLKGVFGVNTPYVLDATKTWTVIAVRSFDDVYKQGEDVYTSYYEPFSISNGVFNSDKAEQANIVTFKSNEGVHVYIPDTFITTMPTADTVDYTHRVVMVDLGSLPNTVDLEYLETEMANVASGFLGVEANCEVCVVSEPGVITAEEHATILAARQALVNDSETIYMKLNRTKDELAKANAEIAALKAYIEANM